MNKEHIFNNLSQIRTQAEEKRKELDGSYDVICDAVHEIELELKRFT